MGTCVACSHPLERHLFGGMCFYCDCKKAVVDTSAPVFLGQNPNARRSRNGTGKRSKKQSEETPRLGNQ